MGKLLSKEYIGIKQGLYRDNMGVKLCRHYGGIVFP